MGMTAVLAGLALRAWLAHVPPPPEVRRPTEEGSLAEKQAAGSNEVVDLIGKWKVFTNETAVPPSSDWPGFRGPNRENIAALNGPLLESFSNDRPPPVLWLIKLGEGHAAPVVSNGRVYLLDYDEARKGDALRCFALDSGHELWQRFYHRKPANTPHGISRTIPAVDGASVVSFGPQCHVLCVSATNGAFRWGMDLAARYGARAPGWGAGQCPLIDRGEVVLAPAGRALLIGVDLATGKVNWETPNPEHWTMSHASVMILSVDGVRQFLYTVAEGAIVGVAADGPERGKLLWSNATFAHSISAMAPSPVPLPDGRFFITAGYTSGGAMFRVTRSNDQWQASILFRTGPGKDTRTFRYEFSSEQQTPVYRDGVLYTMLPSEARNGHRTEFACMNLDGELLWTSGRDVRFGDGLGPYLAVGNRFLVLDDRGNLSLLAADAKGCSLLARADVMGGKGSNAWGPMVFVDGCLLLRDDRNLYCLDMRGDVISH